MRPSVLVTRRIPDAALARLRQACRVEIHEGDGDMPHDELCARVRGRRALVCLLTDRVDRRVIDAGTDLRIIANVAVGYDNVDAAYARARGIVVSNTPDVLTESTADLTWGLMLAITRRIAEGDRLVRKGQWKGWALDFMLGTELRGKTLGIVGLGRIGRAVAARAGAFGMQVACAARDGAPGRDAGVEAMPLDRLLAVSDVLSLHVPLTDRTHHLIDRRALERMKPSAYLINTARGPIVDEAALAWALRERRIAGAALDVYEREPAVHPDLPGLENVLLVPHLGSATHETRTAMADLAARNVLAVLAGDPALTPVPA